MATSKDFKVKNGLVVEQDISFGGSFKDLNGNAIELGGSFEPTLASYQDLATSTNFTYVPSATLVVDDKYDQSTQSYVNDSSKYALRFMHKDWMNWIADAYVTWLPNPDGLSDSQLRTKFKNKNYIMIGSGDYSDITQSPLGSSKINVGDTVNLTIWAVNTNNQLDKYTVQTKITIEPFKLNQYENYYSTFQDPASGFNFGGYPNRFYLLAFDWIKKTDLTIGELYGLPVYDPGWLFQQGNGYFLSSTYYGDRGFDANAQYLIWNYIADSHYNVGYGPMGLDTMSIVTQAASIATFQQSDWQNVKDNINAIAYGSTLPLAHYDASVYNDSQYKLKLSSSNLALPNNAQFKKYIGIGSDPIITIGQLKGYETPVSRTLAFNGQLAKKTSDGTVLNYTTTLDVANSIPGWVNKISSDSQLYSPSGYILRSSASGLYFDTLGLSTVVDWGASASSISLYTSYDTEFNQVVNWSNVSAALQIPNGSIAVKKSVVSGSVKTGSIESHGTIKTDSLAPLTAGAQLSINSGGLKVTGPIQTRTSDFKSGDTNLSSVVGLLNTSTWVTGQSIANDLPGGSPVTTNGNVQVSDVVPPGATGKSLLMGNSSSNWLRFENMNAFDIGQQDWTVEAWVKCSDNSTNTSGGGFYDRINFLDLGTASVSNNLFNVRWNWTRWGYVYSNQTGYLLNINTEPYYIGGYEENSNIGAWRHIAYTKSGNTLRMFVGGKLVGTQTNSWTQNMSSYNFFITGQSYYTFYYNYRLTIGAARYTSDFTPTLDSLSTTSSDSYGTVLADGAKFDSGFEMRNVSSAPSGNSSAGGYLYVEGGALKYKGSNGTVTTVGAA